MLAPARGARGAARGRTPPARRPPCRPCRLPSPPCGRPPSIRVGWIRPSATSAEIAEPRDLAPHRVEARDRDRLGGVVDDHVDAGRRLERADVAALAADQPALRGRRSAAAPTATVRSWTNSLANRWIAVATIVLARAVASLVRVVLDALDLDRRAAPAPGRGPRPRAACAPAPRTAARSSRASCAPRPARPRAFSTRGVRLLDLAVDALLFLVELARAPLGVAPALLDLALASAVSRLLALLQLGAPRPQLARRARLALARRFLALDLGGLLDLVDLDARRGADLRRLPPPRAARANRRRRARGPAACRATHRRRAPAPPRPTDRAASMSHDSGQVETSRSVDHDLGDDDAQRDVVRLARSPASTSLTLERQPDAQRTRRRRGERRRRSAAAPAPIRPPSAIEREPGHDETPCHIARDQRARIRARLAQAEPRRRQPVGRHAHETRAAARSRSTRGYDDQPRRARANPSIRAVSTSLPFAEYSATHTQRQPRRERGAPFCAGDRPCALHSRAVIAIAWPQAT